ncbi:Serine/threonine-protein kinase [Entomophthora muscae]|uniref:Serine/threonine-protein kinase n=1 Tax=Entomophthora muscae TaxID=34485 RepID=A0ACC2U149_9FUNG|nr:Serine/threonine-protein kinase [Entomophthora muscae]
MATTQEPHSVSMSSKNQGMMRTPLGEFQIGKTLGEGSYGKVKLIINVKTNEKLAVKIIKRFVPPDPETGNKGRGGKTFEQRILREANLTRFLNHPHIVPLKDCRITKSHFYLFHEYIQGSQLTDRIGRNGIKVELAAHYFEQIIDGIGYCHSNFVVHRDIKVENIMIDSENNVKIIDFGLANFFDQKNALKTFCGSLQYSAPEIMRGDPYIGPEVDIWSIGVVLFAMLTGTLPFDDPRNPGAWECVMNGKIRWSANMPQTPKSLITRLLDPNPKRRINMTEISRHPFLANKKAESSATYRPSNFRTLPPKLDMSIIAEMTACMFQSEYSILQQLEGEMKKGKEQDGSITVTNSPLVAVYHLIASTREAKEASEVKEVKETKEISETKELPAPKTMVHHHSEPTPKEAKHRNTEHEPQGVAQPMRRNATHSPVPTPVVQRSFSENAATAKAQPLIQSEDGELEKRGGNLTRKKTIVDTRRRRANTVGTPAGASPSSGKAPSAVPQPATMSRNRSDGEKSTSEGNWDKESYKAKRASMYETYRKMNLEVVPPASDLPSDATTRRREMYLAKRASLYDGIFRNNGDAPAEEEKENVAENDAEEASAEESYASAEGDDEAGAEPSKRNSVKRTTTIHKPGKRLLKSGEESKPSSLFVGTDGEKPDNSKEMRSPFLSTSPLIVSPVTSNRPQDAKPRSAPRRNDPPTEDETGEPMMLPIISNQRRYLDKILSSYRAKASDMASRQSPSQTTRISERTRPALASLRATISGRGKKKVTFDDQVDGEAAPRANEIFESLRHPPDVTSEGSDSESLPPKRSDFGDGKVGIFKSPKTKPADPLKHMLDDPQTKPTGEFDLVPGVPQVSITDCLRSEVIRIAKVSISTLSDQFLDGLSLANIDYEWLETAFDFQLQVPLTLITSHESDAHFLAKVEIVHVTRARSSAILMTDCQPGTVPKALLPGDFPALVKSYLQTLI